MAAGEELSAESRGEIEILLGESLELLPRFGDGSFRLVYIDPPFNTGHRQTRRTIRVDRDTEGDRTGFGGRAYRTEEPPGSPTMTATTTTLPSSNPI
ncbi:MAG: hypothetical protein M9938_09090 [Solirubrobacterales bacterium]|nr:hypothetical protein [Solirubrobacterales bacterium]